MCKFCEGGDRIQKGKFVIYMTKWSDGTGTTLSVDYNGFDENGDDDFEVNYCPICGEKLNQVQESTELTEALETLKDNGYLVESTKTEIDCSNWHWVKSMSSYNNNYYYDTLSNDEFYLEECDEDYGDYLYYTCDKSGKKLKYLGYTNREGSVENCNGKLVLDPSMPT